MNDENLIPISSRTPRERQEISRKGGVNSAKKKKERKMWAEILNTIGGANAGDKYKDKLKKYNIKDTTYENVMLVNGVAIPAIKGDKWAIEQWGKITGNMKENVNLEANVALTKTQQEIEDLLDE